jgi:putative ABC transport system substrate-binding protein
LDTFRGALSDLGYVESRNLAIEVRSTDNHPERFPALVGELLALPVDVIVTGATPATLAASQATSTTPIVAAVGDPVGIGVAASLGRPGGNVTGLTTIDTQLSGKRLELLQAVLPDIARVAVIWNPTSATTALNLRETEAAATQLGMVLTPLEVQEPRDLDGAFGAAREGADAVVVLDESFTLNNADRIADLAARYHLPLIAGFLEHPRAGSLMSYGPNRTALFRRAAYYVDRILKGAKPLELPIEQPREFDFVINLKTAQALGLTIPQHVLLQATEVLQ